MLLISWATVGMMSWRKRGVEGVPKIVLGGFVAMTFAGWLATLAGWYTTEIGRQPWLVNGVLSTKDAVADVPVGMVLSTLLTYLAVYAVLTVTYILVIFYLARKAAKGETVETYETPRSGAAQVEMVPGE